MNKIITLLLLFGLLYVIHTYQQKIYDTLNAKKPLIENNVNIKKSEKLEVERRRLPPKASEGKKTKPGKLIEVDNDNDNDNEVLSLDNISQLSIETNKNEYKQESMVNTYDDSLSFLDLKSNISLI